MAQYIKISGKAANKRIERAIPKLQAKGMDKDQATAVAIRLESQGRLTASSGIIAKRTPRGVPIQVPTGAAAMALAAIKRKRTPTRTKRATSTVRARSAKALQKKVKRK